MRSRGEGRAGVGEEHGGSLHPQSSIDALTLNRCPRPMQVILHQASSSNPGIPPSSLMSFLRHKPEIAVSPREGERYYLCSG